MTVKLRVVLEGAKVRHEEDWYVDHWPLGQGEQELELALLHWFTGHQSHVVEPGEALNMPGGHGEQFIFLE